MTSNHNAQHEPAGAQSESVQSHAPLASVLRTVAGAPAGWRPSRRGSFLVMVVGTLALLAVMAVIYSTIGNHDLRMVTAEAKRERLDDVPQQIADYISRVIAADTLSTYYDLNDPRNHGTGVSGVTLQRRTADYPSTDWFASSLYSTPNSGGAQGWSLPFSPTGGVAGFGTTPDLTLVTNVPMPPAWRPSTPWLASTEPTFLNYAAATDITGIPPYLFNHDWAHISNISPDGRFVNLWNLRNNWGAQSGFNANAAPYTMSDNLSLYDNNGKPQTGVLQTDFASPVDFNHPAHFDSRQQWLFRPARPSAGLQPGDKNFDTYQYADADGDGMFDSRWQELKENRAGFLADLLHTDGKYRYFVAVRIIDASALVNVNTAGDFRVDPGYQVNPTTGAITPIQYAPVGSSPGEIDLRNLLTNQTVYAVNGGAVNNFHAGYDGIFQPGPGGTAVPLGTAPLNVAGNYGPANGTTPPNTNPTPPNTNSGYDQIRAYLVGDAAYNSLRLALGSGAIPPPYYRQPGNTAVQDFGLIGNAAGFFNTDFAVSPLSWDFAADPLIRGLSYGNRSSPAMFDSTLFSPAQNTTPPTPAKFTFSGSFGIDDLSELLVRRSINDPNTTSQLEAALDGRDDFNTAPNAYPDSTRFGVLRSNRDLDVDLAKPQNPRVGGRSLWYPPKTVTTVASLKTTPDPNYSSTMLHFAADIRQRLTTISGARNFRSTRYLAVPSGGANPSAMEQQGVAADHLDPSELKIDPRPLLSAIETADKLPIYPLSTEPNYAALAFKTEAIHQIFTAYADALLPTSGLGAPWGSGKDTAKRATEFYGKSPEVALHVAAHMAVNAIDSYDNTTGNTNGVITVEKPTVQTLLVSKDATNGLNTAPPPNQPDPFAAWHASVPMPLAMGGSNLHPLELPASRLGSIGQNDTMIAPAVNVFGIEAQPFISQVASFTVYADTTINNGGDDEGGQNITIKGDLNFATNTDLMYRVVAFQLTNPFGVDINLGGLPFAGAQNFDISDPSYPRLDRDPNFYYIKFGDHTFKVAALEEKGYVTTAQATIDTRTGKRSVGNDALAGTYIAPPAGHSTPSIMTLAGITIPAGKTIVCYALSDLPQRIMQNRLGGLDGIGAGMGSSSGTAGTFFNQLDPTTNQPRSKLTVTLRNAIEHYLGGAHRPENGSAFVQTGDVSGVYWIPEIQVPGPAPNPADGQVIVPQGTDLFSGSIDTITLWHSVRHGVNESLTTATPATAIPGTYWDGGAARITPAPKLPPPNDFTNDEMVDRFRMPAGPGPNALNRHLPAGQTQIKGTDSSGAGNGDSADPNKLYMLTMYAFAHRKANPANMPVGAIPAYCLEPKFATDWNFADHDQIKLNAGGFAGTPFKGAAKTPQAWYIGMTQSSTQAPSDLTTLDQAASKLTTPLMPTTVINGGTTPTPVTYDKVYPEISIADNDFTATVPTTNIKVSTFRVADMLLPLGIGPEEMPFDRTGAAVTDMDKRWTTLGEALALALGYQTNPPTGTPDVTFPYFQASTNGRMVLDRGNLRLDDYVPFYDADASGDFTPGDIRIGLEIPLAQNILDMFTSSPAGGETLTRPTPGLLNINTASLATTRASLSMLSPPPDVDAVGRPGWWWPTVGGVTNPLNSTSDIAAAVHSYRDKNEVYFRPNSLVNTFPSVDFSDLTPGTNNPLAPNQPDDKLTGRELTTRQGIFTSLMSGLHEQPGFRSVGELMSVRLRDNQPGSTKYQCNMDFLGFLDNPVPPITGAPTPQPGANGRPGMDSVLYANPMATSTNPPPPANAPAKIPSMVPDSYKDQLAIINGVLGNVSTRSDYFVAWFLVEGFQKSDVQNLQDTDPMVPSIQRRFVMVIDRSKVTKQGDKPDILLFREVPVDATPH
jgi:hypothetical protein